MAFAKPFVAKQLPWGFTLRRHRVVPKALTARLTRKAPAAHAASLRPLPDIFLTRSLLAGTSAQSPICLGD